jgi:hypothetical protein
MSAEDILEQISGVLDDDSLISSEKVYAIRDIVSNEAPDVPFTTPRARAN